MYIIFLLLTSIALFFATPLERCSEPRVYDNLRLKTCYHRTIFSTQYSTEYFDLISGETGKSGKHESILKAINEGMNDLYNKNTVGYNCKYLSEDYDGYRVRHCYFYTLRDQSGPSYTEEKKMYKVIVSKLGLLTEGISVSQFVNKESINEAIADYKEKEGKRLCF